MSEFIKEAKTVEAAILEILEEANCSREDLEIEVLQEPVKGIFGLSKMAKVKAIYRINKNLHTTSKIDLNCDEYIKINEILVKLLSLMNIKYDEIEIKKEGEYAVFEIKSESEGLLIGHHGKTIESFQYLINKIINPKDKEKTRFLIDIGGYLNKHKQNLSRIADIAVKKVIDTKEDVQLTPMNAYDRRIVHLYLKDNVFVKTQSQGEGSNRYIVVSAK